MNKRQNFLYLTNPHFPFPPFQVRCCLSLFCLKRLHNNDSSLEYVAPDYGPRALLCKNPAHKYEYKVTEVYRGLQRFTEVYRGLQRFTEVYRGLLRFTEVY